MDKSQDPEAAETAQITDSPAVDPSTACSACGNDPLAWEAAKCALNMMQRDLQRTKDTMAKARYNHQYEREKMARVIRRLVRYADRVAERHPKAVTIHGQNARVEGGRWLAEFDQQNADV